MLPEGIARTGRGALGVPRAGVSGRRLCSSVTALLCRCFGSNLVVLAQLGVLSRSRILCFFCCPPFAGIAAVAANGVPAKQVEDPLLD